MQDGQLTMQAQTEGGVVDLLVVDYRGGEMRGYVRHDADKLAEAPATPSLFALFGKGYLAITFDQAATGERYQGIVPLEGGSLAQAAEHYFAQSEQIPTLVRVAVEASRRRPYRRRRPAGPASARGRGRARAAAHAARPSRMGACRGAGADGQPERARPTRRCRSDDLLWRLFHEEDEVRTLALGAISKGCRCSPEHIQSVIARFPPEERAAMADEHGLVHVDCEFCAKSFPVALPA